MQDWFQEYQDGECITITEHGDVYDCGKLILDFDDYRDREYFDVFRWLRMYMRSRKWWPNIFIGNDHGNVTLVDHYGKEVAGWV